MVTTATTHAERSVLGSETNPWLFCSLRKPNKITSSSGSSTSKLKANVLTIRRQGRLLQLSQCFGLLTKVCHRLVRPGDLRRVDLLPFICLCSLVSVHDSNLHLVATSDIRAILQMQTSTKPVQTATLRNACRPSEALR